MDFYIQDNWKVKGRLTLDHGLRFTHHGPQYDMKQQASNFFPDQWSAGAAPFLYVPGCASGSGLGCPRVAVDPRTGASLGAGSSVAIGTLVPNSGTLLNGIVRPATASRRRTTSSSRSSLVRDSEPPTT